MPHTKSAMKRMVKAEKRRVHNKAILKNLKRQIKLFLVAVKANDLPKATEELNTSSKLLDRAGVKGYIHANKASRLKSRLALRLNKAQANPAKA